VARLLFSSLYGTTTKRKKRDYRRKKAILTNMCASCVYETWNRPRLFSNCQFTNLHEINVCHWLL
jgi:hypothetical protein